MMISPSRAMQLGDVIRFGNGKAIKPGGKGSYPVYGSNGIIGGSDNYRYENGVIIGRVGAYCGSVVYCSEKFWASDNTLVAFPSSEQIDTKFLYYLLTDAKLSRYAGGAAQPLVTQSVLKQVEVRIPPLSEQKRIAGILSSYDELIENGQRRIKVLETMARNLYRECIQEAGNSSSLTSILDCKYWSFINENIAPYVGVKRYYATADVKGLAIEGDGIDYTFTQKPSRAQKQPVPFSVWFARMKDTYKIAWYNEVNAQAAESSVLSSGFCGFKASEQLYFPMLFLTISSKEFHDQKDLFCTGATQMSLTNDGLSRIQMPVPDKQAAIQLGKRTLPLLSMILLLQQKIQNLRKTRDLLLPLLLSGQISLHTPTAKVA